MKKTVNDILGFYKALDNIATTKMSGRLAAAIMSNIKVLEPHFKASIDTITKIREDNKGNADKIEKELVDLSVQEIEIPELTKVDISAFDSCESIEPATIYSLSFMIND